MDKLISFEEGLQIILEKTPTLGKITLSLRKLSGRILAEDILTPFPLPRFDNSAMDGYAVKVRDYERASPANPIPVKVVATIRAGETGNQSLPPGMAIKIMTGAPIPPGAEAVVMREDVESEQGLFIIKPIKRGANIRRQGGELPENSLALSAGTRVTPPVVGMLATLGKERALVYKSPKATVIITGDELQQLGEEAVSGRIYNSNGPALESAIRRSGVQSIKLLSCPDDESALRRQLGMALRNSDLIITVGGISVGDYDYVRRVANSLGVTEHLWRMAIKPGKPVYFGTFARGKRNPVVFIGLPGNPVSALMGFNLFARTAIRKMTGDPSPAPRIAQARLARDLRKKVGRTEFVRARLSPSDGLPSVDPVTGQESHMVSGLVQADSLIIFPKDAEFLPRDSIVDMIPIEWSY